MLNYDAYAKMLNIQTELCFPFEYGFYSRIGINQLKCIADIGCANAAFVNKIKKFFPKPRYLGYDNCQELLEKARENEMDQGIHLEFGSVEHLRDKVDGIILRLIVHQLTERAKFLNEVGSKLAKGGQVIIIGPMDEKFLMFPELPIFMHRLSEKPIINEMAEKGFVLVEQENYFMPSLLPGYKKKYRDYMIATSNMLGYAQNAIDEIEMWYEDPNSYAQIGLFMYCFKKG
jgi:SAM-dependent methyltransferase